MYKFNLLSLFILLFIASCDNGNKKIETFTLSDSEKDKIVGVVEQAIRTRLHSEAGRPVTEVNVKVENTHLKEIDGKSYLVSVYKDYVTHSLLDKNYETYQYMYAGISCTSSKCSSSDGCIPESGEKCTPCGYGAGDCSKTVSM